jgi:hypothetical protein
MTAKKRKPPERFSAEWPKRKVPTGTLSGTIADEVILARLGTIGVMWPHVEEGMIGVLGRLLPGGPGVDSFETARQIFWAIVSPQIRIKVMRTLLSHSRHNRNKGAEYDQVLKEFDQASKVRNGYVHGLWWTHESGRTFLEEPTADEMGHLQARRVTVKELDGYITRLGTLQRLIYLSL